MANSLHRAAPLALALLALAGCKSQVAEPTGQSLPTCKSGETLTGPSTHWTCTAVSSLQVAAAAHATSAPLTDTADHAASAATVTTANIATTMAPGNHFVIGTPPAGATNDGGTELDVYGGKVFGFHGSSVPAEWAYVEQAADAGAVGQSFGELAETPLAVDKTRTFDVRSSGTLTGNGTMATPQDCEVLIAVADPRLGNAPSYAGAIVAEVARVHAPGFVSDAGGPFPAYSTWQAEADVTLDAGTYVLFSSLHVANGTDGGGEECTESVMQPSIPAHLTVEAL